jgi:hypothetical protein
MYYLDLVTLDDNKHYQTKINSLFFARQAHTDDETICIFMNNLPGQLVMLHLIKKISIFKHQLNQSVY